MSLLLVGTIKASLVVVAALAVTGLLRRSSAALRHGVLAAAVLCAAVAPALERVAPSWHVTWGGQQSTTWILEPVGRITAAVDLEPSWPGARWARRTHGRERLARSTRHSSSACGPPESS